MSDGAYIDDSGKLIIDMAAADKLWDGMPQEQQFHVMCIMFEPIMNSATRMNKALQNILTEIERGGDVAVIKSFAKDALPK